ncbi:hypothetical protein PPROV_001093900 [Pycnococcus provasolii]|uniref:Sec-independent protein translocase protein TATC, chloroplastic n=1 Tax=Pycnococcus provasolii TaxID=41880 RepID=A0A830I3A6_9CHLO|nr:hypothetical protein PPROV_001093900 [Pycnococcus provasolii]
MSASTPGRVLRRCGGGGGVRLHVSRLHVSRAVAVSGSCAVSRPCHSGHSHVILARSGGLGFVRVPVPRDLVPRGESLRIRASASESSSAEEPDVEQQQPSGGEQPEQVSEEEEEEEELEEPVITMSSMRAASTGLPEEEETSFSAEETSALALSNDAASASASAVFNPSLEDKTAIQKFLAPDPEELDSELEMTVWEHLEELRERVLIAALMTGLAILACFCFAKELVVFLEAPVAEQGVRFLQLSPGEYFFTSLKVAGYSGLLLAVPTVLYEVVAYVVPGLTRSERQFLGPVLIGSSVLFYVGLLFSYEVLTPAALKFFVSYADGAVESLWSIDQYFEFVLVLMLSTGLSFQVPVVQVMLGQLGLVSSQSMLGVWRYVVVGSVAAAAVLTPSTDPFTQTLLALPLCGLYFGGAFVVRALEERRDTAAAA